MTTSDRYLSGLSPNSSSKRRDDFGALATPQYYSPHLQKLRKQLLDSFRCIRRLRRKYGATAVFVQELQDEETVYNALAMRYSTSGDIFVESIDEMCQDFCDDLYVELDNITRSDEYFQSFFSDDCDFIIEGCPYRYHGVKNVINALMVRNVQSYSL